MKILNFIKRMFGFGRGSVREEEPQVSGKNHIYYNYEIAPQIPDVGAKFEQIKDFLEKGFGSDSVTHLASDSTPDRVEREIQVELEGDTLFLTRYREAEVILRGPDRETEQVKERIGQILGVNSKRV